MTVKKSTLLILVLGNFRQHIRVGNEKLWSGSRMCVCVYVCVCVCVCVCGCILTYRKKLSSKSIFLKMIMFVIIFARGTFFFL